MRLIVFIFLFFSSFSFSQTQIFKGDYPNPSDLVYSISNKVVKKMSSTVWGEDVLYIRGNKVYSDAYASKCLYTIIKNKVYKGDSDSIFDLIYEFENDKFYQTSTRSLKKCLFTIKNNQIFIGDSISTFNCIFSVEYDDSINNDVILIFLCIAPY